MHRLRWAIGVGVFLFLATAAVAKDLTLKQHTSLTDAGGGFDSKEFWGGRKRATDLTGIRIIVDLDAQTVTSVDRENKRYGVRTFADLKAKAAANQKAGEKAEGNGAGPAATVQSTSKTDKIVGYDVQEYTFEAGNTRGSVWVTAAIQDPSAIDHARALASLAGPGSSQEAIVKVLEQTKGIILRSVVTTTQDSTSRTVKSEVVEITEGIPADAFTIPEGYTKADASGAQPNAPAKPEAAPSKQ